MGLRYKTDDHLWSSFFHEAVHVLKHSKKTPYLETDGLSDDAELEAGRIAADILIPRRRYEDFVSTTPVCSERIVGFADSLGIAPGIVVGRLQHDGVIPYTHCNGLKRRFKRTAAATWASLPAHLERGRVRAGTTAGRLPVRRTFPTPQGSSLRNSRGKGSLNESDAAPGRIEGSNQMVLVGPAGLEPATGRL